jgi:integrase
MKLPYRKPHVMRHGYATWLHEAGPDIRWAQRQRGHATIAQTSDTCGHLETERHEERVNLDEVLTPRRRPATSYTSHPRLRSPARTRNC